MKVLIAISKFPPEYSGPGVRIPKLYAAIRDELGINDVHVICNGIEYTSNMHYVYEDLPVQRIGSPLRKWPYLGYVHEFIASLLSLFLYYKRSDYVHIAGHSGVTAAALVWARVRKIPVLQELVNAHARPSQKILFWKARPWEKSQVIAISKHLADMANNDGVPRDKIWTRPNPVDLTRFFPATQERAEYRRKLGIQINDEEILIVSVAKIMPRKNQIFLIDVMTHLPGNYKLVIAGPLINKGILQDRDQDYLQAIRKKISDKNLDDRIIIKPGFSDMADYIHASNIYVLPAKDEGLGTPMLEAISCAVPVIANKQEAAFSEWIKDGENGFLCDLDPKDWAEAILKAARMENANLQKSAEKIKEKFSNDNIYRSYISIIKQLITTI